jgi:hypothetical protein
MPRQFAIFPILLLIGCSAGHSLAPVSGKVTRNGKGVAGASITFQPVAATNPGPSSLAESDANGKYELKVKGEDKAGAVVGSHRVYVTPPSKTPAKNDDPVKVKIRPKQFDFVVPPEGTTSADFDITKMK